MNYLKKYLVMLTVGWYLLMPGASIQHLENVTPQSFNGWVHQGSYDTARECQINQNYWINKSLADYKRVKNTPASDLMGKIFDSTMNSECIASDDPRLAR